MLLLFDIDGTLLVGAAGAHRDAIYEALRVVHGVIEPDRRGTQVAGRTDAEIVRALLLTAGVSAERIDARADDVRIAACEAYARLCPPDLSGCVVPGMAALLARLAEREQAILSLVTGNYEPIARRKLAAAGIGGLFARGHGGFGSDHESRAELPAIARRRATGADGEPWPRARTLLIGDTPRDIACARADGVRVIATATGPFEAAELTAADAVARDAGELGALLDELLASAA
ncbi:MAG: phosphoglycolate phosphatase [Solirubrobacteraceae bacterium]|nr:phosphoglycolate phosphatase [Solirubrobacteraceae bacterium]